MNIDEIYSFTRWLHEASAGSFAAGKPEENIRRKFRIFGQGAYKLRNKQWCPQFKEEGSIQIAEQVQGDHLKLAVRSRKAWGTYFNLPEETVQTLDGEIEESLSDGLRSWTMQYKSQPAPGQETRFKPVGPLAESGVVTRHQMDFISSGKPIRTVALNNRPASQYSLLKRLESQPGGPSDPMDVLHEFSFLSPNQLFRDLGGKSFQLDSQTLHLHGYMVDGPGAIPLCFWMNDSKRILLIHGFRVAWVADGVTADKDNR